MNTVKLYKYTARFGSVTTGEADMNSPAEIFFTTRPISEEEKKNTIYVFGTPEIGVYILPEGFTVVPNGEIHAFFHPNGRRCSLEIDSQDGTPKLEYFIKNDGEEDIRFPLTIQG